jgi:hypothetical protein
MAKAWPSSSSQPTSQSCLLFDLYHLYRNHDFRTTAAQAVQG